MRQFTRSPLRQNSQYPQAPPRNPTPTRWPTAQPCTLEPSMSILPTTSWPGTRGQSIGNIPSTVGNRNGRRRKPQHVSAHGLGRDLEEAYVQAQDGPGRRPVQPDRSTRLPSFSSFDRYPGNQAGMHAAERVRGSRRREGRAGAPPPERPPGLDPASNRAPRPYAPILLTCFRPLGSFNCRKGQSFDQEGHAVRT